MAQEPNEVGQDLNGVVHDKTARKVELATVGHDPKRLGQDFNKVG